LILAGGQQKHVFSIFGKSFSGGSFSVSNEKLPPENHYLPKNFCRRWKFWQYPPPKLPSRNHPTLILGVSIPNWYY
jgi:hypothetical protein